MDSKDLFRSATRAASRSTESLKNLDEDALYAALAVATSGQIEGSLEVSSLDRSVRNLPRGKGPSSLGKKIFQRWSRTLHDFCCNPTSADKKERDQLVKALTGQGGGTAVITAILMSTFAMSPVVAPIIAALLVRLIIAPAANELCIAWDKSLPLLEKKVVATRGKKKVGP